MPIQQILYRLFAALVFTITACHENTSIQNTAHWRYPAEWEPIDAIWMSYSTWVHPSGNQHKTVGYEIAKVLEGHTDVIFVVDDATQAGIVANELTSQNISPDHIKFYFRIDDQQFRRDAGPIFLVNDNRDLKIADFNWSNYANEHPKSLGTRWAGQIDDAVAFDFDLPIIRSEMISEGGAREVNGRGTLILVEAIEKNRNPALSKEEIEEAQRKMLNVTQVIWLKQGPLEDEHDIILPNGLMSLGVGGHIDEFCRFANDSTILLAEVSKEDRYTDTLLAINYQRLEENYEILKNSVDQNGNPFNIVRVPAPYFQYDTIPPDKIPSWMIRNAQDDYQKDDIMVTLMATSYLNFIFANDLVIIPKYYEPGKPINVKQRDEEVLTIFQNIFPEKEIKQINPSINNETGGGMHCFIQQQPSSPAWQKKFSSKTYLNSETYFPPKLVKLARENKTEEISQLIDQVLLQSHDPAFKDLIYFRLLDLPWFFRFVEQDLDKALSYHKLLVKKLPNESTMLEALGNCQLMSHDTAAAINAFKKALLVDSINDIIRGKINRISN